MEEIFVLGLQLFDLVLKHLVSLALRFRLPDQILVVTLTRHQLAVACLQIIVVVGHLVELSLQAFLIALDPEKLLSGLLRLLTFLIQSGLVLGLNNGILLFNLLDTTSCGLVSLLRCIQLGAHLFLFCEVRSARL